MSPDNAVAPEARGPRRLVAEYFRLQQWEIPPTGGEERFSEFGGRAPVDDHQRGAGGGLRMGGLLTSVDSIGGVLAGLSVQPAWIVTTSMMATIDHLSGAAPVAWSSAASGPHRR